jgi:signal transduction histidine kinase
MRPYISLIFTALVLAFFSGFYLLKFQMPGVASRSDIIDISQIKLDFQKNITPYAIVNFSSVYYSPEQRELLGSTTVMPKTQVLNITHSVDCSQKAMNSLAMSNDRKQFYWSDFVCNKRQHIPEEFLRRPPYMHSSGTSYAYLVFNHQKKYFPEVNWQWVRDNLGLFHVKELSAIQREIGPLGGFYGLIANLSERALLDLVNGEGTILTKEFLLAKINYPSTFDILEYRFYLRDDLNEFLDKTQYQVSNYRNGSFCVYKDGPICWRYNVRHLFKEIGKNTIVSFLGVVFILLLVLRILFSKIKQDKRGEERRKMALQVLTHEFRTPVASLLLTMDRLNRRFNELDEQTQNDVLRLSSEVYRLQRLTEKSKQYLHGSNGKKLLNFNFEKVENICHLLEDVIVPLEDVHNTTIDLKCDEIFPHVFVDTYWLQIITKNLIENALSHGEKPVCVEAEVTSKEFILRVIDQGKIDRDLEDIVQEFSKGNKSQGSGLGLSIVNRVVKELGGRLELRKIPTTFMVRIPNKDRK